MQRIILATGIHVSQWTGFKRYSVVVACLTGLALYIAHYNFSASLPKLWALPRGWALPRPTQDAVLRTRQGLSALCNLTKE